MWILMENLLITKNIVERKNLFLFFAIVIIGLSENDDYTRATLRNIGF